MTELFSLDPSEIIGFDASLPPPEIDESGFMRIWGSPCRVGWLEYRLPSGDSRWERVNADVLKDPKHLASLATPVTRGHPQGAVLLDPKNTKEYQVGSATGDPIFNDARQAIELLYLITDAEAIAAIQSGDETELSCGYWKTIIETDDTSHPNAYRQISRRNNHHALCKVGTARAGREAKLFAAGDSTETEEYPILIGYDSINEAIHFDLGGKMADENKEKEQSVEYLTLSVDGKVYSPPDIQKLINTNSELRTALAAKDAAIAESEVNVKKLTTANDALTGQVAQLPQLVGQFAKTLSDATAVLTSKNCDVDLDKLAKLPDEGAIKQATCYATGALDEGAITAKQAALTAAYGETTAEVAIDTVVDRAFADLVANVPRHKQKAEQSQTADQRTLLSFVRRKEEDQQPVSLAQELSMKAANQVKQTAS